MMKLTGEPDMRKRAVLIFVVVVGFSVALIAKAQPTSQSGTAGPPPTSNVVKYFSKDEVMVSFSKGGTLVNEGNYRVMTAHRTPSTEARVEVHLSYVDVFYIVQGSTTIITGGKMLGEDNKNPDEPRGASIEGGETHHLSAGDVITIQPGVPHLMKDVQGDLLYFVVKVKKTAP